MQTQKSYHILIVDDDTRILKLLQQFLQQHGFLVSTSKSVPEAQKLLETFIYDLIILDVMLPEITGTEFARYIKSGSHIMPIIMLTALSEPQDRISGLEAGANDYLTKPFEPKELLLRIRNLIDYYDRYRETEKIKRFGSNYYDYGAGEFIKDGKPAGLSFTERKLLEILIKSNGLPRTREELSAKMGELSPRSIDVQIARIRNKIESDPKRPQFLKTVRNEGYVLHT